MERADVDPPRKNAIFAEVLGRGGLWGLGYDRRFSRRFSAGAVGSFYSLEGQRVISASAYLGVRLLVSGPHSWFVDGGPTFVHTWADSPVPEWPGRSETGLGITVATGYEYRARLLVRVFVEGVAGKEGALPWLGAGIGWAF